MLDRMLVADVAIASTSHQADLSLSKIVASAKKGAVLLFNSTKPATPVLDDDDEKELESSVKSIENTPTVESNVTTRRSARVATKKRPIYTVPKPDDDEDSDPYAGPNTDIDQNYTGLDDIGISVKNRW